jgi:hypothetical protein
MPILKSLGVADPKVPRAGTLPLRSSRNPFEEVPGLEEEAGELGTLPNGTSCRRRATLEKLAGLAPFRLGWSPGRRAGSPGDGPPRSFLGRVLAPGIRRGSADFGLLARLQGTRAHGDDEAAREAAGRLAFLRLGRGAKPRRASLAERVVPAGEAAPEPPPKVPEPPKMKEPLSGEWSGGRGPGEDLRVTRCCGHLPPVMPSPPILHLPTHPSPSSSPQGASNWSPRPKPIKAPGDLPVFKNPWGFHSFLSPSPACPPRTPHPTPPCPLTPPSSSSDSIFKLILYILPHNLAI